VFYKPPDTAQPAVPEDVPEETPKAPEKQGGTPLTQGIHPNSGRNDDHGRFLKRKTVGGGGLLHINLVAERKPRSDTVLSFKLKTRNNLSTSLRLCGFA